MENKKPNDALMQIDGHLYFADGNFASFEFKFVNGSNIDLVAYSQTLKDFWVRFNNGNTYLYKNVDIEIYQDIFLSNVESIGSYMVQKVKGFFRYEQVEWGLHKASLTDVCKNYRNMQYNLDTTIGNWATDASTIVTSLIGADRFEELFWRLEYIEIPDNCQRIK